jgi:hypothetical protein
MFVSRKTKNSSRLSPDGSCPGTRKKPHVTVAALDQDMLVNCWYIIVMAVCTTPVQPTCEPFV